MREVHIRCLCTLKVHEKTYLNSGWFLVLGLVWFLGFFKAMNGFVLVFCVKLFHLMREVHIRCFCTLKVHEKTDMSSGWFLVLGWVWFLRWFFGFFKAMNGFVLVLWCFIGVLGPNGLQKRFLGQKSIDPDFSATIMVGI